MSLSLQPRYDSTLGRFARDRRAHPRATAYVYRESDFAESDYGKDVSTRFAPDVVVLSPRGACRKWRFPPKTIVDVATWKQAPIAGAWLSPGAQALAR